MIGIFGLCDFLGIWDLRQKNQTLAGPCVQKQERVYLPASTSDVNRKVFVQSSGEPRD